MIYSVAVTLLVEDRRSNKGSDLQYSMTINLEDAVRGVTEKIAIPALRKLLYLVTGQVALVRGSEPITCNSCGGAGQVRMQQGFFSVAQNMWTIALVQAKRSAILVKPCRGQGRVEKRKTLSVKIPAGVDTGDRIQAIR